MHVGMCEQLCMCVSVFCISQYSMCVYEHTAVHAAIGAVCISYLSLDALF